MNICFVTDPLTTTAGSVRPAILLAQEFRKNNGDVSIITTRVDGNVERKLKEWGINVKVIGSDSRLIGEFPTLDAWVRNLVKNKVLDNRNANVIINTSSCIVSASDVYYAQGLMIEALKGMAPIMPVWYRMAYYLANFPLRSMETKFIRRLRGSSKLFIANSNFCASMYRQAGVIVDKVVYPPLDCSLFKPSSLKPKEDYVLTHLGIYGKEGRFPIIKAIADVGVQLKVFGKIYYAPKALLNHPNITFLGEIAEKKLIDAYSNALYTLCAFSHEPFGYIPIESMACGTPVLTYNRQGPSETVVNEETGWLVNSDFELVSFAVKLWKKGYSKDMRKNCRKRALSFNVTEIFAEWVNVLKNAMPERRAK
jgi:glycosyltransferase involved in cell wall biosynthesis